jgi:hypothetical protein
MPPRQRRITKTPDLPPALVSHMQTCAGLAPESSCLSGPFVTYLRPLMRSAGVPLNREYGSESIRAARFHCAVRRPQYLDTAPKLWIVRWIELDSKFGATHEAASADAPASRHCSNLRLSAHDTVFDRTVHDLAGDAKRET